VDEGEPGPEAIAGVPTSTAAFLGVTERGSLRPRLVTSYSEYERWFGRADHPDRYMPHAVNGFFVNGGTHLYVARVVSKSAATASRVLGGFVVRAAGPGDWGARVWTKIAPGSSAGTFRLVLAYWESLPPGFEPYDPFDAANHERKPRPQAMEEFDELSVDPASADFFARRLLDVDTRGSLSAMVILERSNGTSAVQNVEMSGLLEMPDSGHDQPPEVDDYVGDPDGNRAGVQGLRALEGDPYRDVALVYAPFPSRDSPAILREVIAHCEKSRFRFAVLDPPGDVSPLDLEPRSALRDTSHASFNAPWIEVLDAASSAPRAVPPGGHVAGIYARVDHERGVHKAPANEIVKGAIGLRLPIDERQQAQLAERGVNAIRQFPDRGIRLWGARTLSSDPQWKYVSLRRYVMFLERSIDQGTQWVVFEPNGEALWARVRDTVRQFLRAQWRTGALLGNTEEDAFFVKCDRTTMTQDDITNGRLTCEAGVAPVRPAEFVIIRISHFTSDWPPR
jgi:phage tail sheath protein FI